MPSPTWPLVSFLAQFSFLIDLSSTVSSLQIVAMAQYQSMFLDPAPYPSPTPNQRPVLSMHEFLEFLTFFRAAKLPCPDRSFFCRIFSVSFQANHLHYNYGEAKPFRINAMGIGIHAAVGHAVSICRSCLFGQCACARAADFCGVRIK